jgi:D-sedoheptulose 7-phosphate isomerase
VSVERLKRYVGDSTAVQHALVERCAEDVVRSGATIRDALRAGHTLLVCGNGGSAADAQHFAAEIVCRFEKERRAYPAIALGANSSSLTAWGNDYGFDTVFARQVEAFGKKGDVLVAISTSGNSANVVEAARTAAGMGLRTIALCGRDGGALAGVVDEAIVVPSQRTASIQECHLMVYHFWCEMIDE